MKSFVIGFVTSILLLSCLDANAHSWSMHGGPAIIDGSPGGSSKMFGMRTQRDLPLYHLKSADEFGFWVDSRPGKHAAAFYKLQLGTEVGPDVGWFAKAFTGPALISHRDELLGGFLQFSSDFGFGIRDADNSVALVYNHFSSAGLASPNKGRDWILLETGIRF